MKGIATLEAYLAAEKTFLLSTTILEKKVWKSSWAYGLC